MAVNHGKHNTPSASPFGLPAPQEAEPGALRAEHVCGLFYSETGSDRFCDKDIGIIVFKHIADHGSILEAGHNGIDS